MVSGRERRSALLEAAFHLTVFAAAVWVARAWGPGQDGAFDSAFYLDGARHLARGHGYVSAITEPDQTSFGPITRWAPGFSLLMSGLIVLGVPALDAAAAVLGCCYAGALTVVGAIAFRVLGRRNWLACLLAVVAFGMLPATLGSLDALLSDLPFAAFALLAVLLCMVLSRSRRPHFALRLGLGGCLAYMFLLRYAGALFIPGLLLATLWTMRARRRSFWHACRLLIPSVAIFAAVVAAWIARNKSLGPEAFGQRTFVEGNVAEQVERGVHGAFSWFARLSSADAMGSGAYGLSLLPLVGGLSALLLLPFAWRTSKRSLILLVLPALSYFVCMAAAASRMHFDAIDHPRFWIPVWPLSIVTILAAALRTRRRWLLPIQLAAACLVVTAAVVFTLAARNSLGSAHEYRGLLSRRWALAAPVLPAPEACRLFTMDPRPFMLHRELGPTSGIPLSMAEYAAAAPHHRALCLAVVNKRLRLSTSAEQRRPLQAAVVDTLLGQSRLQRVAEGAGVTVYRVRDAEHP
jgi:hypothetical protein